MFEESSQFVKPLIWYIESNRARCSIKVLELIGLPCLKYLALNSNLLTSIDTQNLLTLKTLDVSDNRIQELTLGTSPLEHLKLSNGYLTKTTIILLSLI